MTVARKKSTKRRMPASKTPPPGAFAPPPPPDAFGTAVPPADQVETSALSLHELFVKQASTMLKRSDLDEEQKQAILIAMSCPCCGAGGMWSTAKLTRRE